MPTENTTETETPETPTPYNKAFSRPFISRAQEARMMEAKLSIAERHFALHYMTSADPRTGRCEMDLEVVGARAGVGRSVGTRTVKKLVAAKLWVRETAGRIGLSGTIDCSPLLRIKAAEGGSHEEKAVRKTPEPWLVELVDAAVGLVALLGQQVARNQRLKVTLQVKKNVDPSHKPLFLDELKRRVVKALAAGDGETFDIIGFAKFWQPAQAKAVLQKTDKVVAQQKAKKGTVDQAAATADATEWANREKAKVLPATQRMSRLAGLLTSTLTETQVEVLAPHDYLVDHMDEPDDATLLEASLRHKEDDDVDTFLVAADAVEEVLAALANAEPRQAVAS